MPPLITLAAPSLLASCGVVPPPDTTPPLPPRSIVALGQKVMQGDMVVTPLAVVEDSRCPVNARCVWAGRLVIRTRLQIEGWHDIIEMELGKNYHMHGRGITLVSVEPGKSTDREIASKDYRFVFEKPWYVRLEGVSRR